jgi:hypothetical protein
MTVQAQYLVKGDIVASGEEVLGVARGLSTPAGKVEVWLRQPGDSCGRARRAFWGANTEVVKRLS